MEKINKDDGRINNSLASNAENIAPLAVDEEAQLKRNQIKFRWWKCYTLLNNPELVFDIKRKIHEEERKKKREEALEKLKQAKEEKEKNNGVEPEVKVEEASKKDNQIVVSNNTLASSTV